MEFKYTPTTEKIQPGSTQYNVQPNLSLSRAFQGVEKSIMAGMKYQEQVNEEDFRKRQVDLENTMSTFNEEYAKANFREREMMVKELEDLVVTPYGEDNRWDRALGKAGKSFKSRVVANLEQEREQMAKAAAAEAKRRAMTEASLAYLGLQQQLQETTDLTEQRKLVNGYFADNVLPYKDTNPEAYTRALGYYVNANDFVVQRRRAIADESIRSAVMTGIQADIAAEGGITPERYQEHVSQLEQLSDFAEKRSAYLSGAADFTLNAIRAQYNDPNRIPTQQDVDSIQTQLDDLVKADPHITGSQGFLVTQNMATTMQNTVNNTEKNDITAMLYDGGVSQAIFDKRVTEAQLRGLYSEEQASQLMYQKKDHTEKLVQRERIVPLIQTGDIDGLQNMVNTGQAGRTTIQTSVKDLFSTQHAQLVAQQPERVGDVNTFILNEYKPYREAGLAPTKLDIIDETLKLPRSGELMSQQQLYDFIKTYEAGKEAGYPGVNDSKVTEDYLVIRGMLTMGIPNPAEKLYNAKASPLRVSDKDIESTFGDAIGRDTGWFTDGLNPNNAQIIRSSIRPLIKTMLQAGVEPSSVEDLVDAGMSAAYMRFDTGGWRPWGKDSEVWMPRSEGVPDEGSYRRVWEGLDRELKASGSGISYVGPFSANEVEGDWLVVDTDGNALRIPYADITVVAQTGVLPK